MNFEFLTQIKWKEQIKTSKFWIYLFALSQVCISAYILFDYDISSVKYLPRLISLLFIFLTASGLLYWVFFAFFKRKMLFLPLTLSLAVTNAICILNLYFDPYALDLNNTLNHYLVVLVVPFNFIKVSMDDGNLGWSLALACYLGAGLMIYGNWFLKNKNGFENKYEKQVMYIGGGLYLFLFPIIFVFTHFTFVGTNYQYMQGMLQYTDEAVKVYEKQGKRDFFDIKALKWFPSIKEAENYYKNPNFKNSISNAPTKLDVYNKAVNRLEILQEFGWYEKEPVRYNKMERFHDWIQVSYNFNFDGVKKEEKITWFTEISLVLKNTSANDEDLLRHSVFYMKELKDGSVYVMLDFNRTFKDHKMNYIFNLFFVLYHILYLALFAYLLSMHSNKHMKSKKLT